MQNWASILNTPQQLHNKTNLIRWYYLNSHWVSVLIPSKQTIFTYNRDLINVSVMMKQRTTQNICRKKSYSHIKATYKLKLYKLDHAVTYEHTYISQ